MSVKQDIKDIKAKIDKLYDSKLINKANNFDEISKHLDNIKFDGIDVKNTFDKDGKPIKRISYKLNIDLYIDEDGEILSDDMFESINRLNLLRTDDMQKLYDAIYKEKESKERY